MSDTNIEKHEFQAEVKQLLDIVIHSLYTDKEIFIRELVSNAADSLEKLRHLQLTNETIYDDKLDLEINITTDDTANTITIQDFGVGMTREELRENLGTIAHSGSKAFVKALTEMKENAGSSEVSENLIGQFGVGFYSAFMVASEVRVYTHSWKDDAEHLLWTSDGSGNYAIEPVDGQRRGCKIVVQLTEENKEFANKDRVKGILERYSKFVPVPINLNGDRINTVQAIWLRNKNEIKEEEYTEFYKYQANAFDEPLLTLHFNADAPLAINSLLFTPRDNPERFGFGRVDSGVSLYCRKVLIDDKPEGLLPEWLRFLKGVVDSADLPLNISRETMQDSALVQKLNKVLTGRYLKSLDELSDKQPEKYKTFYDNFGIFLKEGITTDFTHRDRLSKLLRFESSLTEKGERTSLADYLSRMKEGQKEIYYLFADSRDIIESGPYIEAFKARNIEVLYLYEAIDEFVMSHIGQFEEKKLISADQADIELEDIPSDRPEGALSETESAALAEWIKDALGDKVKKVEAGKRLVDSPAVALNEDKFFTPTMRKLMQNFGQGAETPMAIKLEINPGHGLIRNLAQLKDKDEALAREVTEQLFDNAMIAAGYMDNPRAIVGRIYNLLERVSKTEG